MFFNKKLRNELKLQQEKVEALSRHLGSLSAEVRKRDARIESLRRRLHQRSSSEQSKVDTVKAERLVGIKFKALFDGRYQATQFIIGLGQCGKNVKWFTVKHEDTLLIIQQHHTDGSRKEFTYRMSDIDGRIQYDYEMVELTGIDAATEMWNRKRESKSRLMGHGYPRVVNIKLPD